MLERALSLSRKGAALGVPNNGRRGNTCGCRTRPCKHTLQSSGGGGGSKHKRKRSQPDTQEERVNVGGKQHRSDRGGPQTTGKTAPTGPVIYEIEAFLECKRPRRDRPGSTKILVKWAGCPLHEATWESRRRLREDLGSDQFKLFSDRMI